MDNLTYPMGGFFLGITCDVKSSQTPNFNVGKAVHVVANIVKLGRQCPWTRYDVCVGAHVRKTQHFFNFYFILDVLRLFIYLFIYSSLFWAIKTPPKSLHFFFFLMKFHH
jgi:hypothetical protein